jgi:hypothetical protein
MNNGNRAPILLLLAGCELNSATPQTKINSAPTVQIKIPETGSEFPFGSEISFTGQVNDLDQVPDSLVLLWNSDSDGPLSDEPSDGSGNATLLISTLGEGQHVITLTAIDEKNASGSAWIQIGITEPEDTGDNQ